MLHKSKFESASSILDYIWTGEADYSEDSYESVSESFEEISPSSLNVEDTVDLFEYSQKTYKPTKNVCCTQTNPHECSICFEECEMISVPGCGHQFCSFCILNHIDIKISEGINLRHQRTLVQQTENVFKFSQYIDIGIPCPHRGCTFLMNEQMIRKIMTSELLLSAFDYVLLDQTVNQELAKDLTRCPLGCGNFLQEDCYCANEDCRMVQKRKREIEERRKIRQETIRGASFLGWSINVGTKLCPSCNFQIEKNGGCDHMYCIRCKTLFNWSEAKLVNRLYFKRSKKL